MRNSYGRTWTMARNTEKGEMRNVPSRARNMARKVANDENEAHTL
jgi:hypothetical protein